MFFPATTFVILATIVSGFGDLPQADAQKSEVSDKIKELLKERLVTVSEVHGLVLQGYKNGEVSVDQVVHAKAALLNAKLDLAETKGERIKIQEEMVTLAEEWEKIVEQLAAGQQATRIDVLKAKAHLLEARIGWERAKQTN